MTKVATWKGYFAYAGGYPASPEPVMQGRVIVQEDGLVFQQGRGLLRFRQRWQDKFTIPYNEMREVAQQTYPGGVFGPDHFVEIVVTDYAVPHTVRFKSIGVSIEKNAWKLCALLNSLIEARGVDRSGSS
jgi:hypothetical protein